MNIRDKLTEIIERELHPIPTDKRDTTHRFYYKDYRDNLICQMDPVHCTQYGEADGGEMVAQGSRPAKMASLASSSAMTYNLLGNRTVMVKNGSGFAPGKYEISYEKQLYTLSKGGKAANLDAFLANRKAGEAVFCEMKMLEWLSKPGDLKEAYLKNDYYFCDEAYQVFSQIAYALRASDTANEKNAYPSVFTRYDAWQMFKHTLAIYNATSQTAKDKLNAKHESSSLAGQFQKISLANVVFEIDTSLITDEKLMTEYAAAINCEHQEAQRFIDTILAPKFGLIDLFNRNCGVSFDIKYIPAHNFASFLDKTPEELKYLRRYCCK